MSLISHLRPTAAPLRRAWRGPSDLPRALKLEWRFAVVRWIGLAFVTPALGLMNVPADRLAVGYAVLAVAALYNLLVTLAVYHRRGALLGYVTAAVDTALGLAMTFLMADPESPFIYFPYIMTVTVAMRHGYLPAVGMVLLFTAATAYQYAPVPMPFDAQHIFRFGFLLLTGLLAAYLREEATHAQGALEQRLRFASVLDEATDILGGHLELDSVLDAATTAAAHLFSSTVVVLVPGPFLRSDALAPRTISTLRSAPGPLADELAAACERHIGALHEPDTTSLPNASPVQAGTAHGCHFPELLSTGQQALVLVPAGSHDRSPLAALAVIPASSGVTGGFPSDVLAIFIERVAHALENALLYRAVAERGADLQRAYADLAIAHQELLSVDEMKTGFLANVSHELRTPLSSIRGFSEMLLTYDDPDVRQEFIGIINSESERLTRLVEDVLDITRIESGFVSWHPQLLSLAPLLTTAVRNCAPLLERPDLRVEVQAAADLPAVYADPDRLIQVVSNLLNNAAKFTPQGSICLTAHRVRDEIHVSVTDTGVGFPPEERERIFEKFHQAGRVLTGKPVGAGLGLAICRDIVTHHGGRIWADSLPGCGSTFTFSLKVATEAPADAAPLVTATVAPTVAVGV